MILMEGQRQGELDWEAPMERGRKSGKKGVGNGKGQLKPKAI